VVTASDRVFQIGSQQRSDENFRFGCELVRNGYIGNVQKVEVGFGLDPCLDEPAPSMPIPDELHYDRWLGQAPWEPYTEKRVHPVKGYSRPGWLRIHDYGAGMITGWGAHHLDAAQWGLGTELTGPTGIEGTATFCDSGLWDVHTDFHVTYTYPNGIEVLVSGRETYEQGVKFYGADGWVHVKRWEIDANPKSLLKQEIGPDEIHLYDTTSISKRNIKVDQEESLGDINPSATVAHKRNFIDCIKSRAQTIAPVELAHRSGTMCLLGDIAMHLDDKLQWDPDKEKFVGNDEANRMLSRPFRKPWKYMYGA
jgi:predicted dehydrogenase